MFGRSRWAALVVAASVLVASAAGCSRDKGEKATPKQRRTHRSASAATTTTTTEPSSLPIGADPHAVPARRSTGCGGYAAPKAGPQKVSVPFDGTDRWYDVDRPPAVSSDVPVPLVVDLHGYLEGAELHRKVSALASLGKRKGFVTVTPQGEGEPDHPIHWTTTLDGAGVRFVDRVLDEVEANTCIDLNRVFATGFSNGAFLTSTLACVDADRFAAVAPVAGIRDVPGCRPSRPVPVISFHGTKDQFVVYAGGIGTEAMKLPAPSGEAGKKVTDADDPTAKTILPGNPDDSVPGILAAWAARNDCHGKATETQITEDVDRISRSCPDGQEVELYRVDGGGHSWPGSKVGATLDVVTGHTTDTIDATELMWAFFEDHPLRTGG